tara:strand:- start:574 stop:843 length:270 start_codon:yes stop_codon:yes gene_type:complete
MANLATPGRWLKHKTNGTIYGYSDILAANPAVEEVPEELAFPEKFIPEKQKGRESKIDLSTETEVVDSVKIKEKKSTGLKVSATGGKKK